MKNTEIIYVPPEMVMPELGEIACGANSRGGLGLLGCDTMDAFTKLGIRAKAIVPLYGYHWVSREKIDYDKTPAQRIFDLTVEINGKRKTVEVRKINVAGVEVFGLCSPDFNVLYTADRWERLQQEALIGHAVPDLLKRLEIKPDIVWLQEGHTATVIPVMLEDPYFNGFKSLFTTHTPVSEGMEKFNGEWKHELGIHEKYYYIFVKDGLIDMTRGGFILSDWINAVSDEHCEVTREIIKKMFSDDPELTSKIISKLSSVRNGCSRDIYLSCNIKAIGKSVNPLKIWKAHQADKEEFIQRIEKESGVSLDLEKPLLGFVRRLAWYKNLYPMLAPIIKAICAGRNEFVETEFGRLEGLGIQVFAAGRAHESDTRCLGWMAEFQKLMENELRGKFVFSPEYGHELRKKAAVSCDIWFSCPMPKLEACGTSDDVATKSGVINLASRTGGAMEHIKEFNVLTCKGSGFFIEPYHPVTVYNKLKIISDLYYAWIERGDKRWLRACLNAFNSGKDYDNISMMRVYMKIFETLLNKK